MLLLIVCPVLPDAGSLGLNPSSAGAVALIDGPGADDGVGLARAVSDVDDLREAFVPSSPRVRTVARAGTALVPAMAQRPDTREDHPPDRPPRRVA